MNPRRQRGFHCTQGLGRAGVPRPAFPARGSRRRRPAAIGLVSALAVATATTLAPAASALEDDFETGPGGWYAYGPGVTSGVVDGAFCVDVPAGLANPWDAAAAHNGIALEEGEAYTFSFTAWATEDVSIRAQVGANQAPAYPTFFGEQVALGATPTEHTVTVTPTMTVDDSDTGGQIAFQLGGQTQEVTVCLDDVSLVPSGTELLPQTTFADGKGAWSVYGAGVTETVREDGALCLALPGGAANPWDAGLSLNGLPVTEGESYVLSFTASAEPATPVRVIVGEAGGAYRTVLDENPALTPELGTVSLPFTATATFPADAAEGPVGQVAFHLGKAAPYTFCISEVSLRTSATPPPPYTPDTGPRVRVNQHGYLPEGPHRATLVTDATQPVAWELRSGTGAVLSSGSTEPRGTDPTSGLGVHVIDFGSWRGTGTGLTLVADGETSHPFDVDADLYQQLRYDALNSFYKVRSGIEVDGAIAGEEYAREAGHVNDPQGERVPGSPNKGDYEVPCLTAAEDGASWSYGDWTCPAGYTLDVVGGWYDAGDHGKYVVNGGLAAAQLLGTYERALYAPTGNPEALGDGTLDVPESANGVPDVLDEAAWELDWMMSMQVPASYEEYAGMVHHKIHDVGWTGLPLLPSQDPQQRRLHRPSTAATLNLAAAAAQGARLFAAHEDAYPGFAERLLQSAVTAWEAALAHPDVYAPAGAGNNGGGPYDDTDVSDEFYWAAAELFLTTGEQEFGDFVLASPVHTADIWTPSGLDWRATGALGRLDLALVPNDLPGRDAVQRSVVAGAEKYLAWQEGQPFGTTYPGVDGEYQWGSNSMVVNNQVVLAAAFDLTGDHRFREAVVEAMDYLLGRNALNQSYVTGYGEVFSQNQHSRWFAHMIEPSLPNPPVGSLAGGPNSDESTWDPTMQGLFGEGNACTPQMCYVDHIQSWASNEITVNWNSALSWVASFLADQGAGAVPAEGGVVTITTHPQDVTAAEGTTATFTAAATGSPEPTVQWQERSGDGQWQHVAGATTTTLTVPVTASADGRQYRAVFTNTFGTVATDAATLTVTRTTPPAPATVTVQPERVRAGQDLDVRVTGMAAGETVTVRLDDVVLGQGTAGTDGTLALTVRVPVTTTPGPHTVAVAGATSLRTASASVLVLPAQAAPPSEGSSPGRGSLPRTGGAPTGLLALAGALVLTGAGGMGLRRALR